MRTNKHFRTLSEPIVSKPPTLSTDDKFAWFINRPIENHLALLCRAQGYPIPLYRYFTYLLYNMLRIFEFSILEPIGSKSPTFSTDDKLSWYVRTVRQSLNLLCPAQAFPVPVFR